MEIAAQPWGAAPERWFLRDFRGVIMRGRQLTCNKQEGLHGWKTWVYYPP